MKEFLKKLASIVTVMALTVFTVSPAFAETTNDLQIEELALIQAIGNGDDDDFDVGELALIEAISNGNGNGDFDVTDLALIEAIGNNGDGDDLDIAELALIEAITNRDDDTAVSTTIDP